MEFVNLLGLFAGICTSSSIVPQIIVTLKKKKSQQVSILMFIVLMTGNSLWIYYGVSKSDVAIVATNILSLVLNIVMLILKFRYRNN